MQNLNTKLHGPPIHPANVLRGESRATDLSRVIESRVIDVSLQVMFKEPDVTCSRARAHQSSQLIDEGLIDNSLAVITDPMGHAACASKVERTCNHSCN